MTEGSYVRCAAHTTVLKDTALLPSKRGVMETAWTSKQEDLREETRNFKPSYGSFTVLDPVLCL
jgi:hypothetical protein